MVREESGRLVATHTKANSYDHKLEAGLESGILYISYPYNVDLTSHLIKEQDKLVKNITDNNHTVLTQVIIKLDGISEVSQDCKEYLISQSHQCLYDSVAFVLSKGNMSVLEKHYLMQLLTLHKPNTQPRKNYPIGVFKDALEAERWMASRPGSHHLM